MDNIRIGSAVQLTSDGPIMKVGGLTPDPLNKGKLVAFCLWFDKNKMLQKETFSLEILQEARIEGNKT